MCESCKKFNNITIVSRWELQLVVDEIKRSIEKGELLELPGGKAQPPYIQTTNISVYEIEENKPVHDQILINLKCTHCNARVKLSLDTYHWKGGVAVEEVN